VNESDPTTQRTSVGGNGQKVVKSFTNYHKVAGVVQTPTLPSENGMEFDVVDLAPSNLDSPEDSAIFFDLVGYVRSKLSPDAVKLLDFLLMLDEDFLVMQDLEILRQQQQGETVPTSVKLDEIAASKYFGKPRIEIHSLRIEIIEALPKEFLDFSTVSRTSTGERKKIEPVRASISAR
jgi:hypothetical protein